MQWWPPSPSASYFLSQILFPILWSKYLRRNREYDAAASPDGHLIETPITDDAAAAAAAVDSTIFRTLSSRQKEQISVFVSALLEWNEAHFFCRMNLTSEREEGEVMERHVEDSLALLTPLPWNVTLLESMQKRCFFLEHVVRFTGLSNVKVLRERAENVGQSLDFRELFDVAVARAVAEMRILAEYCLPLVRVGGLFIAAKGHNPQEEIRNSEKAIQLMGGSMVELCTVESYSPLGQRTAVICFKELSTPKKYPRNTGIPSKFPL
ncbi:hypothetical protein M5K25_011985 [Dendrobium thyrsiflorum]|uniref:Ribosomal RNA small subunit methyltransferase G n=1 Tax=Dendrobium thyrsiflorum TaxID=117978 RepID=A0ABD0V4L4_DENTH